ncbi:MAG: 16S rRNA (adenine(1518)-N(6)/adenine(1519)-N(6))-dimethyltransferase RsmA [Candidatus Helarchaeota archaeon]
MIVSNTRRQLISETKRLLQDHNLRPFKRYSQNFVIEPKLINWHLQYSKLCENDVVVEVGAGLGTLTKYLAENVGKVIAIERDPKLVEVLQEEFKSMKNVQIILSDVLKLDSKIFEGRKIVSNPPYKISSPLTFKIIKSSYVLSVMSYQKEFAERLVSSPGAKTYGRITIGVNYYANVEYLKSIPKSYFYPMPKVDSALIRLTPILPPFELKSEERFFEFIRTLFSFRKKTVKRALKLYLKGSETRNIREEIPLSEPLAGKRIFNLSIEQFYELFQLIQCK